MKRSAGPCGQQRRGLNTPRDDGAIYPASQPILRSTPSEPLRTSRSRVMQSRVPPSLLRENRPSAVTLRGTSSEQGGLITAPFNLPSSLREPSIEHKCPRDATEQVVEAVKRAYSHDEEDVARLEPVCASCGHYEVARAGPRSSSMFTT